MLTASEGELWQTVEPEARARPGWVAFAPTAPSPRLMRMQSLVPGADPWAALADHICSASDALELLSLANIAASAVAKDAENADLRNRALPQAYEAITFWGTVNRRYDKDAIVSAADATKIAAIVRGVDASITSDATTSGPLTIQSAAEPLYTLVELLLTRSVCVGRPVLAPRFNWWLIPLVLIGTALVVHSETKDRPK